MTGDESFDDIWCRQSAVQHIPNILQCSLRVVNRTNAIRQRPEPECSTSWAQENGSPHSQCHRYPSRWPLLTAATGGRFLGETRERVKWNAAPGHTCRDEKRRSISWQTRNPAACGRIHWKRRTSNVNNTHSYTSSNARAQKCQTLPVCCVMLCHHFNHIISYARYPQRHFGHDRSFQARTAVTISVLRSVGQQTEKHPLTLSW